VTPINVVIGTPDSPLASACYGHYAPSVEDWSARPHRLADEGCSADPVPTSACFSPIAHHCGEGGHLVTTEQGQITWSPDGKKGNGHLDVSITDGTNTCQIAFDVVYDYIVLGR